VKAPDVHVFAYGLPAPGDFYVTAQGGRTVRLGGLLGAGHTFAEAREIMAGETLEAAEIISVMGGALPKLTARGVVQPEEFPLLRTLIDVVVHGLPLHLPLDSFFGSIS
jgi:glycerol-3-phosphate dehydrogenase (NAD(P)+)